MSPAWSELRRRGHVQIAEPIANVAASEASCCQRRDRLRTTFALRTLSTRLSCSWFEAVAGSQVLLHDGEPLYGEGAPPSFSPMMRQTAAVIDRAANVWTINNYKPNFDVDATVRSQMCR